MTPTQCCFANHTPAKPVIYIVADTMFAPADSVKGNGLDSCFVLIYVRVNDTRK